MSCEIGINNRVFCDNAEEAMSFDGVNVDGKGFMDTVVDSFVQPVVSTSGRVISGAADQVKGILQAPAYIVQYVTCTVPEYGKWDSSWSGFGQNCSWSGNPLIRSMDVVNRMVLNTANDLSAGTLHDLVREVNGSQSDSAKYYFPELDKSPEGMGGFAVRILALATAVSGMKAKSAPVQVTLPKAEPVAYGTSTVLDRNFAKSVFDRPRTAMAAPILSVYTVIETLIQQLTLVRTVKYVTVRTRKGLLESVCGETYVDHPALLNRGDIVVGAGYAKFERLPNGGTRVTLDGKSGNFPTERSSVRFRNEFDGDLYRIDNQSPGLISIAEHWQKVLGEKATIIIDYPVGGE